MDLIQRCQAGDQESFAILFQENKDWVYRLIYLLLGNAQTAEDALQEVFIKVFDSLETYDPEKGAFSTWVRRIAVNHCLNQRRKRWLKFLPLSDFLLANGRIEGADALPLPEEVTIDRERARAIWQAVQGLSPALRVAVVLRFYEELSYQEIAEVLEIPMGTVKWRLHESMKTLRKVLKEPAGVRVPDSSQKQPKEVAS